MSGEEMRTCRYCGHDRPLSGFRKCGRNRAGVRKPGWRCRECYQVLDTKHSRTYRDAHRDVLRERWRRKSKADNPRARRALRHAVDVGKVIKPSACESCGAEVKLDGHHHLGYDRPLDVQWLCRPCHNQAHRVAREAAA